MKRFIAFDTICFHLTLSDRFSVPPTHCTAAQFLSQVPLFIVSKGCAADMQGDGSNRAENRTEEERVYVRGGRFLWPLYQMLSLPG